MILGPRTVKVDLDKFGEMGPTEIGGVQVYLIDLGGRHLVLRIDLHDGVSRNE